MRRLSELQATSRVLDRRPVPTLRDYIDSGGGVGLDHARQMEPGAIIDRISEAGLRGRGGGGFPTGLKWGTVARSASPNRATTVVVNAAEGEPGTYKDRTLLRRNPYRLLEGVAIACRAVGADRVRIGIKASFTREIRRLDAAITEALAGGWFDGVDVEMVLGAGYLFGEETAMLEVIEGRQPFPRVAPPFRRGVSDDDVDRSAAHLEMAEPGGSAEPPALVNNVETYSNVPLIVANCAEWFRSLGTPKSPGTILVTISGDTNRAGVAEVPLGTTLGEAIDLIGWGIQHGRRAGVVIGGTANPMIPGDRLDLRLTYEDMSAAGYGLGSAGFIVYDDTMDPVAVAAGISRFLAVESCGQCEHCKFDGTELSVLLRTLSNSTATTPQIDELRVRQSMVGIGARCNLGRQQEAVVGSLLNGFGPSVDGHHFTGTAAPLPPVERTAEIAPIVEIVCGTATLDPNQASKQLDWSYGDSDSGVWPAARFGDTPFVITEPVGYEREASWAVDLPGGRMHPIEQIDAVHDELDHLLHDLAHGDPGSFAPRLADLDTLVSRHVDVTQRILYPTLRRDCGAGGDELADRAEADEAALVSAVAELPRPDQGEHDGLLESLRGVASLLRRHVEDERDVFEVLDSNLDEQRKKVLLDALAEAATDTPRWLEG